MQDANENLSKKTLHIGSTILLSYIDEKGRIFYATVEGFTQHKIRLRESQDIKRKGRLNQCLFTIVPTFQYTQYQKGKELFDQKSQIQPITTIDQRDAREDLPKQVKKMEDESIINSEQYIKLKGQSIFYGQSFQFLHLTSNKYLSFYPHVVAEFDSEGWKSGLREEHCEETYFKFISCFSFQQETGGYIFDEDTVNIVSTLDVEPGLNASKQISRDYHEQDKHQCKRELTVTPEKRGFWKIIIYSRYSQQSSYLSVFDIVWINYAEQNLNLLVQKYSKIEEKKYLKFEKGEDGEKYNKFVGDSNGMFVVENDDDVGQQFQLGGFVEWNKKYKLKHLTSNYYLKVETYIKRRSTANLEDYEEENKQSQGYHTLVAIRDATFATKFEFEYISSTLDSQDKEMAVKFLDKDAYFRMCFTDEHGIKQWFRTQDIEPDNVYMVEGQNYIENITIPVFDDSKRDESIFKIAKASINDVRLTKYLLSCMKSLKKSKKYLEIYLDASTQNLVKDQKFRLQYQQLMNESINLEKCLQDLQQLCYNRLGQYLSFDSEYGEPDNHIQNLLKQQYFFEILIQILVICFPSEDRLKEAESLKLDQKVTNLLSQNDQVKLMDQIKAKFVEKKKSICSKVYKLIRAMCDGNQNNQEYCSKYLPIFAFQSRYLEDVIPTVVQVIQDFEELLLNLNKEAFFDGIPLTHAKSKKVTKIPTQESRMQSQVLRQQINHSEQYKILGEYIKEDRQINQTWDLMTFYCKLFIETKSNKKRIEIIQFLKQAANLEGKGININQELGYKCILGEGNVFERNILIRIKSDGPQLKIYRKGEPDQTLLDYFHNHNLGKLDDPYLVPFICESMRLYSWMCNTRNYTWKKFAENFFNVESLIENIQNTQYDRDIRSIICQMLNKLYIDQEPRRIMMWPELCKVERINKKTQDINNTMVSTNSAKQKESRKSDPVDLEKVKEKLFGYMKSISSQIDQCCNAIDLKKQDKQFLKQIFDQSPEIYNNLTLEVIKLLSLLIKFGKFPIILRFNTEESLEKNSMLFDIIKFMKTILEFDVMYPETRRLLMDNRNDPKKEAEKKKQEEHHRILQGDDDVSDPSQGENFQKQVQVLSLKMNEFMYKQLNPTDANIKLEICQVFNILLDIRMDFYLNNLKQFFRLNSITILKTEPISQIDLDDPEVQASLQKDFEKLLEQKMEKILPTIMKTGTSVDLSLNEGEKNLFAQFGNIGLDFMKKGLGGEDSKFSQLEALDFDKIVGFSMFPSLISIFCLNQNLDLETQILSITTRLYNQRYEFAELSSKLLILFDERNIDIFKRLKKQIHIIGKYVDESETWVQNLHVPEHMETLQRVQGLFNYFEQLLFKDSYIDKDDEVQPGNEGKVDETRQDIIRHLKVNKLGVDLIKDSVFMVTQVQDKQIKAQLCNMFRQCFSFLKHFVMRNPTNQMEMSQYITALVANLNTDLGQVELLCEIFRNNKKICIERCNEVLDDFKKLIQTNGRQARYLEFFLVVHQINNYFVSQNQKAVLNLFIDPRYKDQLFFMEKKNQSYPTFNFTPSRGQNYLDEPYEYHAKLIEVCASCTIGKDGLLSSENKLKAQVTFKYIMNLLCEDDMFTENLSSEFEEQLGIQQENLAHKKGITKMKAPLLCLIFYTYLESEKISDEIFKCFPEITKFISKEHQRIINFKSATPDYQNYFFNFVMLVLNGFIKVFNRELGAQAMQQKEGNMQKQIQALEKELHNLRLLLQDGVFAAKFDLNQRQKILLDLFKTEQIMKEDQNINPNEDQLNPLKETQLYTHLTSTLRRTEDQQWNALWQIFLKALLNHSKLLELIQKEQKVFAEAIFKVEELFKKDKSVNQQINKTKIFQRLIDFLGKSSAQSGTITTFKLILNVLKNYIYLTEKDENLTEEEQQELDEQNKSDNQNFLSSNNAMQMTLTLLSDYSDPINAQRIFNDLIQFGIDLLDGGNNESQKAVWSFFSNFPSSEVFFMRLHNEIQLAIKNINKTDENLALYEFQKQSDLINNILRLLQLFAEGHYTVLQEYMHFQYHNHHSYDLIQDFIDLLKAYIQAMNQDYFENMLQNFDTITEFIQGPCRINQNTLLQANFLEIANKLLKIHELDIQLQNFNEIVDAENEQMKQEQQFPLPIYMYSLIKYKCSITLISLLEARYEPEIVNRMQKQLDMDQINQNLQKMYYTFDMDYNSQYTPSLFNHFELDHSDPINHKPLSFIIETAFNLYFIQTIFEKLEDPQFGRVTKKEDDDDVQQVLRNNPLFRLIGLVKQIIKSIQDSAEQAYKLALKNEGDQNIDKLRDQFTKAESQLQSRSQKFFKQNTGNIEIMLVSGNLEEVYFPIPPYCQMDEESKKQFNESANRASNKSKVTSLQNDSPDMIQNMKLNYEIQVYINKFKTLEVIINNIDLLRDLEFMIALIINILLFLFYQKKKESPTINDDGTETDEYGQDYFEYDNVVELLGSISIALSFLIVAFFLSRNAPIIIDKAWRGASKDKFNILQYLIRTLKTIYYFLSDFFALYYIAYGAASVLGRFLHPFFFSFHLFEVMIRFPVLLNVIKSVWIPKQMIAYTGLLLLIFMYCFSVFGYLVLYDSYSKGFCDSMWICFLCTIDTAFFYDSGLGGALKGSYDAYPSQVGYLLLRFVYDNLFNLIIVIIMLNIVMGIIIDMFGQLRSDLQDYKNDLENYCFICGYDKETIEKESSNLQNFSAHIKYEHKQWYYLFYMAYLSDKSDTEYTGTESYVADKVNRQDITWFPLNKAMCLRKDFGEGQGNSVKQYLDQVKEKTKELQEQLDMIMKECDI